MAGKQLSRLTSQDRVLTANDLFDPNERPHGAVMALKETKSLVDHSTQAHIFATKDELDAFVAEQSALSEAERTVKVGDNLYITDTGVPDYWWIGKDPWISELDTGVINVTVDAALNANSNNPVQNKVVKAALDDKIGPDLFRVDDYRVAIGHVGKAVGVSNEIGLAIGYNVSALTDYPFIIGTPRSGILRGSTSRLEWRGKPLAYKDEIPPSVEPCNTEVWKGNVGFGEQDTFIGAKKTADGEGQFQNGYPRLHNHGQDIHEVSGFSRDSREGETVWSHRLLLPWDLAKANDTSYLMAAVQWESTRLGVNAKFVQPLLPTNTAEATAALGLPYALPCFENSPIYWNGHLIFGDGSGVKQIKFPWDRIQNGATAKVPTLTGGTESLTIEDDEGRTLVIYADGSGGYVHTKGMTTTPNTLSFVTKALLDRITALETVSATVMAAPEALEARTQALETENATLKATVQAMEARIQALETKLAAVGA